MHQCKPKQSEKPCRDLPTRPGVLYSDLDEEPKVGHSSAFDAGEELGFMQPHGGVVDKQKQSDFHYRRGDSCIFEKIGGNREDRTFLVSLDKVGTGILSVGETIAADEKRSDLLHELSQKEINLEKLQRIANTGLSDNDHLRPTVWKILLGYLPSTRDLWEKELNENRQKYEKLKEDLLNSPSELTTDEDISSSSTDMSAEGAISGTLERHKISDEDHPLSVWKTSAWHQYFKLTEIGEQIDRDLQRTHPEMKFFSGETSFSRKNRESMRNILLLFAKLNPAIGYVQGMNEVLAPIFYVFSCDMSEQNSAYLEADCFACFVRLLGDAVDHFCQQLDNSPVGILATLARLQELLKKNDEELWQHLVFTSKVNPQFYAFRWITLLLTQEFDLRSILRIWDSLLSNGFGVQEMLLRVCCAMLLYVKGRLLSGDFASNLRLLQHYPDVNVEYLLQIASDVTPDTSSYRPLP